MDGLLLIDKPIDWTSFDVVAKVRGTLRQAGLSKPKVGHTGTLDPLASGLLVLVLGSYCKRAQEFSKLDKTYQLTARLGQTSTTGDAEGQKTDVSNIKPTRNQIDAALKRFLGSIEQVPPVYSAIKVNGKRAYELARQGKAPKLAARPVTIHEFTDVDYDYPELKMTVSVSSGTYIRSLVEDLGQALETGAYTAALRRTTVGQYRLDEAIGLDGLSAEHIEAALRLA